MVYLTGVVLIKGLLGYRTEYIGTRFPTSMLRAEFEAAVSVQS